jgi:hypothetical protein
VAKLKYQAKKKTNGGGKTFFIASLSLFIFLVSGWYAILPSEFNKCESGTNLHECGCPTDKNSISKRNIIIVDTTDYIAPGKFPDIENIIESYALKADPFFEWFKNGKKVEMTSIYLLSDKIPSSMLPIGKFCKPPPEIALMASTSNVKMKKMQEGIKIELKETLKPLRNLAQAKESPIIETLAVVTSNATSWTPGGDLILISDMLQNSSTCGWFEGGTPIPKFANTPNACKTFIDKFQANAQPTKVYSGKTNVAVCQLPPIDGKSPKPGLMAFWHEYFQDALGYDFIATCNPNEINERKASLR